MICKPNSGYSEDGLEVEGFTAKMASEVDPFVVSACLPYPSFILRRCFGRDAILVSARLSRTSIYLVILFRIRRHVLLRCICCKGWGIGQRVGSCVSDVCFRDQVEYLFLSTVVVPLTRSSDCTVVSTCLPYSIPRQRFEIDVWARTSGAMRRSNYDSLQRERRRYNMVAVFSCDARLY